MDYILQNLTEEQTKEALFYLGITVFGLIGVITTLCICSRERLAVACSNLLLWYIFFPAAIVFTTYTYHDNINATLEKHFGMVPVTQQQHYEPPVETDVLAEENALVPFGSILKSVVNFAYYDGENPQVGDKRHCFTETLTDIGENGEEVLHARIKCL